MANKLADAVTNKAELKAEIQRLGLVKAGQEVVLKLHFDGPNAILATVADAVSKPRQQFGESYYTEDNMFTRLSKKLLTLTLKKTLFRN